MLKIVKLIFLIALMIMSFFAGVILNNSKLKNNYRSSISNFITKKKEKIFIINNKEINKINKNIKENIIEEDALKINENEIKDNDESLEIDDNIEKSENNINNDIKRTVENDKNEDEYTKKNEFIPVAISK